MSTWNVKMCYYFKMNNNTPLGPSYKEIEKEMRKRFPNWSEVKANFAYDDSIKEKTHRTP